MAGFTLDHMDLDSEEAKSNFSEGKFEGQHRPPSGPGRRRTSDDQGQRQRQERERDRQRKANGPATNLELCHWFRKLGTSVDTPDAQSAPELHRGLGALPAAQTLASLRQDVTLKPFHRDRTGQHSLAVTSDSAEMEEKESSPSTLTYSLKIAMFKRFMIELHGRLTTVGLTWRLFVS